MVSRPRTIHATVLSPIVIVGLLMAVGVGLLVGQGSHRHILQQRLSEAERLADVIVAAMHGQADAAAMREMVQSLDGMGGPVVIAGGRPARILASSHKRWMHQPLDRLPDHAVAAVLQSALDPTVAPAADRSDPDRGVYGHLAAVRRVDGPGGGGDGSEARGDEFAAWVDAFDGPVAVMVAVDVHDASALAARQGLLAAAGASGGVVALVLLCGWVVNRRISRPVAMLRRVMSRRLCGEPAARSNLGGDDELGALGRALDQMLNRLESHRSEARRLAMVASHTHRAVVITDRRGRVEWVNDAFVRMTGYALAEMLGRTPGSVLRSDDTDPRTTAHIERCVREGRGFQVEILNHHRSGRPYWVDVEAQPLREPDGTLSGFISIQTEITARKTQQQRLLREQARLRRLFEHFDEGLLLQEATTGKPLHVSPACGRLLGRSVESLRGDGSVWLESVHPQDRDAVMEALSRLTEAESEAEGDGETAAAAVDLTYRILRPDGKVRWVRERALLMAGDASGAEGAEGADGRDCARLIARRFEDVTDSHDRGRWLEDMHKALADCPDAILHIRADGSLGHANDAAAQLLGCSHQELLGRRMADIDPLLCRSGWSELLRMLEENGSLRFCTEFRRHDATRVPVEMSITPMPGDPPRQVLAVVRDVSDFRRAEADLRSALDDAEQAYTARSRFLAGMSHAIRTPLTSILACAELALAHDGGEVDLGDHARAIRRNSRQLLSVIDNILDLFRIDAGCLHVEPVYCSPIEIAQEVAATIRPRAADKNIALQVEFDGPLPRSVRSDPARLRQALSSLVNNAVQHTDRGGVTIRLSMAGSQRALKPAMQIEVIDTGPGMDAEQCRRLFEPFTHGDGASRPLHGGTGLSLTICRHLAKLLGGELTVSSEPGAGSRFTFSFQTGPLDAAAMIQDPATVIGREWDSESTAQPRLEGRLLLAEDGADHRRFIGMLLRRSGLEVELASNGRTAVDMALEAQRCGRPYDLILMDMQMPVMDGYQATGELRRRGYRGPIMALTGHITAGDRTRCLEAGCDDYATKPIDRMLFFQQLQHHLSSPPKRNVA